MMRGAILSVLALSLVGTGACKKTLPEGAKPLPSDPDWTLLEPSNGGFLVHFPPDFTPTREDQTVESVTGPMRIKAWAAEESESAYLVSYTELPADIAAVPAKTLLEGNREGVLEALHGTVDKEEWVDILGFPGHRMWWKGRHEGRSVSGRLDSLIANGRLYQLQALATKANFRDDASSKRFFESFELEAAPPAKAAEANGDKAAGAPSPGDAPAAAAPAPK